MMLENLVRDLRYAVRAIRRSPVVAAVIVVSLAFGIGVNTVVFSWVQLRLLDPVPGVSNGAALKLLEPRNDAGLYVGTSWLEYRDLRESLGSFSDLFAFRMVPLYVGERGQVERVSGLLVTDNYFSALNLSPEVGRFITPDESAMRGAAPVAVISYGLWRTRFGGTPDAIGRNLRVNGSDVTVIGVVPERFQGTVPGLDFDVWIPASLAPVVASGSRELDERGVRGCSVMGWLAPLVTAAQAQSEVSAAMQRLAQAFPKTNGGVRAEVLPFTESPRGPQRMLNAAVLVLQGIMLLLLVAVCGNLATLMLARAAGRHVEMGARLALGSGRARIVRLVLAENVLLALAGSVFGAAIAVWGTRGLLVLPLVGLPIRFQTAVDGTGLAFAIALGVAAGIGFGAAPALQLARLDPSAALRPGGGITSRQWLRSAAMAGQVALAVMVLIVAAMFLRSVVEMRTTDPGFDRHRVLLAAYDLAGRPADAAFSRGLAARTLERLRAIPGVEHAAIASSVPLDIHGMPSRAFTVEGHVRPDDRPDEALANIVTPGYFEVMGIPLRRGGDFADLQDTAAPRQAIVNETFVNRYVSGSEPVGRRIEVRGVRYIIAAVAADSLYNAFGEAPTPIIYFSYRDMPQPRGEIHVRARGSSPAGSLAPEVRRAMRDLDGDLPVFNVRSMTDHVETNLIFRRIPARMFAVLGPILLLLAAIGVYAVVSYAVSTRTAEIGIRLALGASPGRVVLHFMEEHLGIVVVGAAGGWLAALAGVRLLVGGEFVDLPVFAGVPAILLGISAFAAWLPAWRAAKLTPAAALRQS